MDFEELQKEAIQIQSKSTPSSPEYTIKVIKLLDLSPKEFSDHDYNYLLNEYEKIEKIKRLKGILLHPPEETLAEEKKPPQQKIVAKTTFSEKELDELEQSLAPPSKEEEVKKEHPEVSSLEVLESLEKEEEKGEEIEKPIGEFAPEIANEVSKGEVSVPYFSNPPTVEITIPPILEKPVEEIVDEKYESIKKRMESLASKMNKAEIKKRMIELTKQLFKEKSIHRKNEIKAEISALRNQLNRKTTEKSPFHSYLNIISDDEKKELNQAEELIISQCQAELESILSSYDSSLKVAPEDKKQQLFQLFSSDIKKLEEKLRSLIDKYEKFLVDEHKLLFEKVMMLSGEGAKDKAIKDKLKKSIELYSETFKKLKLSISAYLSFILSLKDPSLSLDNESRSIVDKVLSYDFSYVLNYMHSKYPDIYKKYENKEINKIELMLEGKKKMLEEKLGASKINNLPFQND